jgi:hypothetical protein
MDAVHYRHTGLSTAGRDRVKVHRVAITGNGSKLHLVGHAEGTVRKHLLLLHAGCRSSSQARLRENRSLMSLLSVEG